MKLTPTKNGFNGSVCNKELSRIGTYEVLTSQLKTNPKVI